MRPRGGGAPLPYAYSYGGAPLSAAAQHGWPQAQGWLSQAARAGRRGSLDEVRARKSCAGSEVGSGEDRRELEPVPGDGCAESRPWLSSLLLLSRRLTDRVPDPLRNPLHPAVLSARSPRTRALCAAPRRAPSSLCSR